VAGLNLSAWQAASESERLASLRELERGLASQEGREPCEVLPMVAGPLDRGLHETGIIYLNEAMIKNDGEMLLNGSVVTGETSYLAVETLFHEARHAYQEHVAQNPELADSPAQADDFKKNRGAAYFPSGDFEAEYFGQPVELDARRTARDRTDVYYGEQALGQSPYAEYRNEIVAEEEAIDQECRDTLGENYEQVIRSQCFKLAQPSEVAQKAPGSPDEDYHYGYGL
jgi:hypothetical protein